MDPLYFFLSFVCYAFVRVCLLCNDEIENFVNPGQTDPMRFI